MSIKIFNSLTKDKEEFVPICGKKVKMYSCGVTVYDKCHIGHARSLYIFDVIRSYLKSRDYDVTFVRNITDVDDKIIKKGNDLGITFAEVVKDNIDLYHNDLKSFGINLADIEPRATENIQEMIDHIQGLVDKDFAYAVDGDVYFKVRKFEEYGRLSGQSIEKMLEGVRIDQSSKKEDSLDFVLWKKAKEGEPSWESPWGNGRPGWHIECSCMSMKYLDCETLDIHAGGRDLIFPHHENEVAQSEALTGKPFAKYWIHHGLLTINGQKMSKSLGNFITIQDAIEKYSVDQLKMLFLSSHYASPVDFTEEKMVEAHKALQKFEILQQEVKTLVGDADVQCKDDRIVKGFENRFIEAMDNDFNTPQALGIIFDFVSEINKLITADEKDLGLIKLAMESLLKHLKDVLGLYRIEVVEEEWSNEIMDLINTRAQARENKEWQQSDEIRDQLKDMGIIVEDKKDGQRWRRA